MSPADCFHALRGKLAGDPVQMTIWRRKWTAGERRRVRRAEAMSGPNFKPGSAWDDTSRTSSIERLVKIAVVKSTIEKTLRANVHSWFGSRSHHQLVFLDSQWNRECFTGRLEGTIYGSLDPQDLTVSGKVRRECILWSCYAQWQAPVKEKNSYDSISFPPCVHILLLYVGV